MGASRIRQVVEGRGGRERSSGGRCGARTDPVARWPASAAGRVRQSRGWARQPAEVAAPSLSTRWTLRLLSAPEQTGPPRCNRGDLAPRPSTRRHPRAAPLTGPCGRRRPGRTGRPGCLSLKRTRALRGLPGRPARPRNAVTGATSGATRLMCGCPVVKPASCSAFRHLRAMHLQWEQECTYSPGPMTDTSCHRNPLNWRGFSDPRRPARRAGRVERTLLRCLPCWQACGVA